MLASLVIDYQKQKKVSFAIPNKNKQDQNIKI
jgi:hypothetical protein